ncbi:lantibiotic immunity ABC transporter MutG family permease subunit [Clostridium rectalis]|uniref:lantibiotic immunity ABC transporter MutG family permease subunit n=1 Tax=Clostridium rectalis TaxID=2040295 RepID=UPI000F6334DC|nr:lantibiotic immunity ABC transporter MutG family permease subunit [Clostridium rectalis]
MCLIRAIKSEWRKTKRTPFRYIVLLVPILFSLLVISYISIYNINYTFQIKVYELYFGTIGIALPMVTSILAGLNIIEEENAGDFRALLMVPISRKNIYLGKLFMIILVTIIDMLVSLGILLVGMKFIFPGIDIQYGVFLQGTIFGTIGALFLYVVYLIISLNFGIGATIAVGVGGSVSGALLQTGLGDKVWNFVPWAWSGRLSSLPCYTLKGFIKFKGLNTIENINEILKKVLMKEIYKGLSIATISFILVAIAGMVWFKKWEGRKIR